MYRAGQMAVKAEGKARAKALRPPRRCVEGTDGLGMNLDFILRAV